MVLNRAFSKMDLSQLFYSCILTLFLYLEGKLDRDYDGLELGCS